MVLTAHRRRGQVCARDRNHPGLPVRPCHWGPCSYISHKKEGFECLADRGESQWEVLLVRTRSARSGIDVKIGGSFDIRDSKQKRDLGILYDICKTGGMEKKKKKKKRKKNLTIAKSRKTKEKTPNSFCIHFPPVIHPKTSTQSNIRNLSFELVHKTQNAKDKEKRQIGPIPPSMGSQLILRSGDHNPAIAWKQPAAHPTRGYHMSTARRNTTHQQQW